MIKRLWGSLVISLHLCSLSLDVGVLWWEWLLAHFLGSVKPWPSEALPRTQEESFGKTIFSICYRLGRDFTLWDCLKQQRKEVWTMEKKGTSKLLKALNSQQTGGTMSCVFREQNGVLSWLWEGSSSLLYQVCKAGMYCFLFPWYTVALVF